MGQYYYGAILKKNWKLAKQPVLATLNSWDLKSGCKLMEHSWVGNGYVNYFERILENNPQRLVWIGDYADKKVTHYYSDETEDRYGEKGTLDIYDKAREWYEGKSNLPFDDYKYYRFAVNVSKHEYVRIPKPKKNVWNIHPLPLLCSDGNGRGGGDYHDCYPDFNLTGRWAYDLVFVTNDESKLKGYKELSVHFTEDEPVEAK